MNNNKFEVEKVTRSKIQKQKQQMQQREYQTCKTFSQDKVSLSCVFKSRYLETSLFTPNFVNGFKGYASIMANIPISEGNYYFEVKIIEPELIPVFQNVTPQIRVGIGCDNFNPEISLGSDNFSYSFGQDGFIYHDGIKQKYGVQSGIGDTIGMLIQITPPQLKLIETNSNNTSQFDFRKGIIQKENENIIHRHYMETNQNSMVKFYKNGEFQGIAFQNIKQAFYYAGISLYMHARVHVNFGPNFNFPPSNEQNHKPYSQLVNETIVYDDIKIY